MLNCLNALYRGTAPVNHERTNWGSRVCPRPVTHVRPYMARPGKAASHIQTDTHTRSYLYMELSTDRVTRSYHHQSTCHQKQDETGRSGFSTVRCYTKLSRVGSSLLIGWSVSCSLSLSWLWAHPESRFDETFGAEVSRLNIVKFRRSLISSSSGSFSLYCHF